MPVFVISLHAAEPLCTRLHQQLGEAPTVLGIDGRQLPASRYFELNRARLRRRQRPLTPGETGCALSHLEAWRRLLASGADAALIFEHDVQPGAALARLDTQGFATHFDVVVLGCQQGLEGEQLLYGRRLPAPAGSAEPPLFAVPRRFTRYLFRSTAYWLRRDAAARLVEAQERYLRPADSWGHWSGELGLHLGFVDACAHPLDLRDSLLEGERQAIGYSLPRPSWKQWRARLHDRYARWRGGLERCCTEPALSGQ